MAAINTLIATLSITKVTARLGMSNVWLAVMSLAISTMTIVSGVLYTLQAAVHTSTRFSVTLYSVSASLMFLATLAWWATAAVRCKIAYIKGELVWNFDCCWLRQRQLQVVGESTLTPTVRPTVAPVQPAVAPSPPALPPMMNLAHPAVEYSYESDYGSGSRSSSG